MEIVASLNRYFEIIGLLYTYSHPDLDDKEVWNKAAKEYHISADELSRKMGSLPKKYFSAFQKAASVSNQEDFNFFFSDEDDAFVLLLQIVCATHPQWFSAPNPQITNEEVVIAFANLLCEDDKREIDAPPSDKARYTRIAENAKESIRVLKEKLADVLENRSERNRWISHFTQFSTMETLDRKAVVHMIQSIKVIGKKELEITFTYQDEYQKAIQLIQLAEQTSQRKVG